jgi:diguanylate cyclase (GGDEF)-like protein
VNVKKLLANRKPDPSKVTGSYQDSLIGVTRAGTYFTTGFFLLFAFVYWLGDYPLLAVWVNLAAVSCSVIAFFLITRFGQFRKAAHLITFAIYLSSAGVVAISGGVHSSSILWQIFVPVAAFIMTGLRAGLRWGFVSFLTVLVFFGLESGGLLQRVTIFETTTSDRLIDLLGAIVAVSIAIWYSEFLKSRSLRELEETKAQLNYFATIDPLTNTFNRRHFMELSERRIKRTYTSHGQASFLLFDLDHFKKINDAHGHIIGDQILRGIAQICKQHLRTDDILGRFGGEEFVILLPDTKLNDARHIAERLRRIIAETPIETEIGPIFTTVSIGVTLKDRTSAASITQLLSRADRAMYLAKQSGRNRVIIWEERDLQAPHPS